MINDNESLRQRKKEKYHQRKYHSHHSENHPVEISCIRNQLGVFFGYIFFHGQIQLKKVLYLCVCVCECVFTVYHVCFMSALIL